MAKHKVLVSIPAKEITNTDVIFDIFSDDSKLGQLRISKGGLDYYPRDKKNPFTLTWEQFDKMITVE